MSFTEQQNADLAAKLPASAVKSRSQAGRSVSYVEGWHVIAEANRIFGFDNWTRETIDIRCVAEKERKIGAKENFAGYDGWGVSYLCKVRVVVCGVAREGCGAGHGIDRDLGQAHESALKEAETDAMKRAFMTFGNPFGLALYDKERANVADEADESRDRYIADCKAKIAGFPDQDPRIRPWWDGEAQARRDFGLTSIEVNALKEMVIAKLPKKAA